jgi:hypothetical protein
MVMMKCPGAWVVEVDDGIDRHVRSSSMALLPAWVWAVGDGRAALRDRRDDVDD